MQGSETRITEVTCERMTAVFLASWGKSICQDFCHFIEFCHWAKARFRKAIQAKTELSISKADFPLGIQVIAQVLSQHNQRKCTWKLFFLTSASAGFSSSSWILKSNEKRREKKKEDTYITDTSEQTKWSGGVKYYFCKNYHLITNGHILISLETRVENSFACL